MEWILIFVPLVYLILTPYTKVEESFNIQAVHDVLYHQANITGYDHLEFPGVVPRTFIGPLFLGFLSGPFVLLANQLGIGSHFFGQYVVRTVLCLCVVFSLIRLKRTLQTTLGVRWGWWYVLVTASQYHLLYYSSRPLPNIVTLPLVLLAVAAAFTPNGNKYFLTLSGAAIIWFRAELAILLGILLMIQILAGKLTVTEILKTAIPAGITLVAVTTAVDSCFWQRLVWPEAEVFYFNTILNKSSEWGTSPFLWYFYSALPRGLGTSVFLIPIGIYYEQRVHRLVLSAVAFIFMFSFLPHKELRFIIYTFPLLNTAVAAACHRLWENRNKSALRWLLGLGVIGHLVLNVTFTVFLLMVARINYPGGEAIARLHQLVPADLDVNVHIGNLAAQTGVSRFTELNENWRYSKEENLEPGSPKMLQFTHLIVEAKSKYSPNLKPYARTHNIIASVDGFAEIAMNHQIFPPVRIKTKPLIFILERNFDVAVPEEEEEDATEDENKTDPKQSEILEKAPEDTIIGSEDAPEPEIEIGKRPESTENDEQDVSEENISEEPDSSAETTKDTTENTSKESLAVPETDEHSTEAPEHESLALPETDEDSTEAPEQETITKPESLEEDYNEPEKYPEPDTTNKAKDEYYEYDGDDLLATESNERLVESLDFRPVVEDLEERLKSNNIDEVLLNDDVISYIKALTKVEYNGPQDIDKLRKALSSILNGFKEVDGRKQNSDEH